MSESKSWNGYTGIDCFRFAAALLIVAIHTSPLASYTQTGDFILTRIVARVGVPFFLMTSGFFLIRPYQQNRDRLKQFVKKTALIYGAAILLYVPVNLYNGYFSGDGLLPRLIQDLVFDGTLYHLWYLPAAILGAVIAWRLAKRYSRPMALAIGGLLYLVGLFGDSYYGVIEDIALVKGFYGLLFQVFDHTRNGLFLAPIFFLLGGMLGEGKQALSLGKSLWGFGISFVLMLAEALTLHHFQVQRHDSMYLFLLPCMYFLFSALLHWRGARMSLLRDSSLLIYLIHPMVIVTLRLVSKKLGLQELLVENSLAHFLAVCLGSVAFSVPAAALWERLGPKRGRPADTNRAWIELNPEHLAHNAAELQQQMPEGCRLMAVVKTEAYGHGAFAIASRLEQMGVEAFAVATLEEGIRLRRYGIRGEILVLGYTSPGRARELRRYGITQTLIDFAYANSLNRQGMAVKCHIKIDTGMHRLGISSQETEKVKRIFRMKNLKITGIYTHLCCADSRGCREEAFTREQIRRFQGLLEELISSGITVPKTHIQSSYGLLNYPELACDYVRVGIALYGVLSQPGRDTRLQPKLKPVMALKARVVLLRAVSAGETVGYGRTFTAARDSRIAILPIGYGDGLPRSLSNKSGVMIRGQYAPVAGRICMDQLAVDVTEIPGVSLGDVATVICGETDAELSAPMVAETAETISNELLCRMGARLPVVVRSHLGQI